MNLLFPAMLAGLAGLSVPVILHLIARSRFPVWDFPTIRLLRYEKRDNVFARKLVDPWQLLLRLLVIALLVFAMSRLFLPGLSKEPAPRNLIVVLDASASMEMAAEASSDEDSMSTLELAKQIAGRLLSQIALPSRCALVAVGDEIDVVPMGPTPDAALAKLPAIKASGGTGPGLVRAVAQSCEMLRGRREVRSQIVVLTDLRSSAFRTRNQRDLREITEAQAELGQALEIIVVDVGAGDAENVAIIDAYLRGRQARVGDDAHVITRIRNLGAQPKPAEVTLTVAGKQEPAFRKLMLQPEEEVVVDLSSLINRSVRSFATVMLRHADAVMHDNVYSVPLVVAPSRNVLIVNGAAEATRADTFAAFGSLMGADEYLEEPIDGAHIMQYVLNPARELGKRSGGTGIEPKVVTPDTLAAETLSRYDIIVLYDVNSLPGSFPKDLDTFVREGRSVVIFCSGHTNPVDFNDNLANPKKPYGALSPAQIGTERKFNPNIGVRPSDGRKASAGGGLTYSPGLWLAPFREQRQGGISVIRLARARELRGIREGANVLLQGTGGRILAIEAKHGQGRVVLFGFGVELSRGNIAMTKVFPQLMWRLVEYLTGRLRSKPSDSLVASEPAALDASEPPFGAVEELELVPDRGSARPVPMRRPIGAEGTTDITLSDDEAPEGAPPGDGAAAKAVIEPRTLRITPQKTVMLEGLPVGHYRLRKKIKSGYTRPIAVNPDPRESEMTRVDEKDLRRLFTADTRVLKPDETAGIAPMGFEAWQWIVALLMVAYLAEAVSAYAIGVMRARKLEEQEAL